MGGVGKGMRGGSEGLFWGGMGGVARNSVLVMGEGGRESVRLRCNCPSFTMINPAAEIREPRRKEECWKAPDCLMPM